MRLSTFCMATFFAVGSAGIAQATTINLVQNGDFSQTLGVSTPTQFGTGSGNGFTATQFITGWTGNNGYQILYPNASNAVLVNATGEWTGTGKEKLWGVDTPPNGTNAFVGLDGDQTNGIQSSIGQTLTGLTSGVTYTVSFDWAAAQLQSREGETTEFLRVSFGDLVQDTQILTNASMGHTAWYSESFSFVANSTDAFLNFLSMGTPNGLPPMALLTNVSVTGDVGTGTHNNVPEPSGLALFGGGLLGLGLLTMFARRREMGGRDANGYKAII